MPALRSVLAAGACAAAFFVTACTDKPPTAPGGQDSQVLLVKPGRELRATPPQLVFTAIGENGTLTVATGAPGALVAEVSTPECASVTPRRLTRSPAKFTVVATASGSCTVTVTDGSGASVVIPVDVNTLQRGTVVAGYSHSCGLTSAGAAYCWGSNQSGQLGSATNVGTTSANTSPLAVQGGLVFTSLAAGAAHTCGLTQAGVAYCWGSNILGQLGNTTNSDTHDPNVAPLQVNSSVAFVALQAGSAHTCGLTEAGAVFCWGYNYYGQLGSATNAGEVTANPVPTQVTSSAAFAGIAAGENHSCAFTGAGAAYCWGRNSFGQLGTDENLNTSNPNHTPVLVGGSVTFTSLAAGGTHTCGLTATGAAYCWGNNERGQLGTSVEYETGLGVTTPEPVGGNLTFSELITGQAHSCGLTAGGAAYCWGHNVFGQLGSTSPGTSTPLLVTGSLVFISLSATNNHTCGVNAGGSAYCWGSNSHGQLGTTTSLGSTTSTPQQVSGGLLFGMP